MSQSQFETLLGMELHYKVQGEGQPLLLLHGWGGQTDSFLPVANHYAATRRVYSLDFPGMGGKSPAPSVPWSVTEYTDLVAEWMRRMNLTHCDVMGHSFGGRVGILLAATHPELVGKLILVDAAGIIPKRGMKYYVKVYSYKAMKRIARIGWLRKLLRAMGLDLEERIRRRAGSSDYQGAPDAMRATFVRVVNQNLRPYLKDIQAPTLCIYGADDQDTPVSFGQIMEKEIPDAGLVVLQQAGHFSYLDQFPQFIRITDAFLGGNA